MTYGEFHKQLEKANALSGDERETTLKQLEPKLAEIDDEKERHLAQILWEDCMVPMQGFIEFHLEKAKSGDAMSQASIGLYNIGICGKDPDDDSWLNTAFSNKDFKRKQRYRNIFKGLDDINVSDIALKEMEYNFGLAEMANIPDEQIVPVGENFKVGYDVAVVHAEEIAVTITQQIKELAMQTWKIGEPIEENALTNLIDYINQSISDCNLQELNEKNIRSLYKDLIKSYRLDTEDYSDADIDIYSNTFKNLCNIHIYLPIEGEVTGMYFFERYYGNENPLLDIDYYPLIMELQIPDSSVIGNMSKQEEEKAKDVDIKDNRKKRQASYRNKFLNQYSISLGEYSDEQITLLGDLMNYVEYDFLVDKEISVKKNRPSNQVNIFLMFQRPSWELFNRIPKKNVKYRDCFIFLKSELMRHIDLSEILAVRGQITQLLFSLFQNAKIACYHLLDDAILNPNEIGEESSLLGLYEKYEQRIATFDIGEKNSLENIFLDFWVGVIMDEIRHSLGERRRNVKSVKSFDFSTCTRKWNDRYEDIWKKIQENLYEILESDNPLAEFYFIRDGLDEDTLNKYKKFIEKLQVEDISDMIGIVICQLCSMSDDMIIVLPSSYKKSGSSEISLTELLKSKNKGTEIRRLLSYLIEKQFYYNFGQGKEYDTMLDFRIAFEQKLCDLVRKKCMSMDVIKFLIHTFGKNCISVMVKGMFELPIIQEY